MKDIIQVLLRDLDEALAAKNEERRKDEGFGFKKAKIQILGQMSLFAHPNKIAAKVHLVQTVDLDAKVTAEYLVFQLFKQLIQKHGLSYDEDSEKVWLPAESTYTEIFNSPRVQCEVLDPIFALTSKAIKAPEKNKVLIHQALKIFGSELQVLIRKYGGDSSYFEKV